MRPAAPIGSIDQETYRLPAGYMMAPQDRVGLQMSTGTPAGVPQQWLDLGVLASLL
jgi:hypothetical protein